MYLRRPVLGPGSPSGAYSGLFVRRSGPTKHTISAFPYTGPNKGYECLNRIEANAMSVFRPGAGPHPT